MPDRQAAAHLGRYMIRCPVVLERMSLDEDTGEVTYRTRPSRADHPEGPVARWDVYELIGVVTLAVARLSVSGSAATERCRAAARR